MKTRVRARLPDGSDLVSLRVSDAQRPNRAQGEIWVREIAGVLWRGPQRQSIRLWTELLDEERYPAAQLLGLYAQPWGSELATWEWKLDLRGSELLQSHRVETAAQEALCGLLALAVRARVRLAAAERGELPPLGIRFAKVHWILQILWEVLQLGRDLLRPQQVAHLVDRALSHVASQAVPKRRPRSCPRADRQPIGSWLRVTARTEHQEAIQNEVVPA